MNVNLREIKSVLLECQQHVAEAAQPALAHCSVNNKITIVPIYKNAHGVRHY